MISEIVMDGHPNYLFGLATTTALFCLEVRRNTLFPGSISRFFPFDPVFANVIGSLR